MLKSEKNSFELDQIIANESVTVSTDGVSMEFDSSDEEKLYALEVVNLTPKLCEDREDGDLDLFIASMEKTMSKPKFGRNFAIIGATLLFSTVGLSMIGQSGFSGDRTKMPVPMLPNSVCVENVEQASEKNIPVIKVLASKN